MNRKLKYVLLLTGFMLTGGMLIAQISPGELSQVHAHLEGLKKCTECHILGEKETSSKCLECHQEIKNLMNQKKGYHASAEVKGQKCASCHGEHLGKDYKLIRFDAEKFDHQLAGFKLEGKHGTINCNDCHKEHLIRNLTSQKKQGGTYLGLGTSCVDCHEDVHQNTLSNNCVSCHNQVAFRPAIGFDHSKTKFQLVGKHQTVDCAKCHVKEVRNGKNFQQFAGVKFDNCTSCHEDVHKNKFGNDCRKCHNEFSFTQAKTATGFNHNLTDFPLEGKHVVVNCKKCHTSGSYTRTLKFKRCTDCHSDYHEKQFQKNEVSPDCSACHSVNGFSPASFSIERHNQSGFKLEGAHLATPCLACHKTGEKWNFKLPNQRCVNCHENVHKNALPEKYMPDSECRSCHSVDNWKLIAFNHDQTSFKLSGKHAGVSCRDCHFRRDNGVVKQQFSNLAESCENCHEDIHFKQFEALGKNDCARCHTFNNWLPDKFNHDNARFKLDGKHSGLQCAACHQPTDDLIRNYIVYKFKDITCASCH
ncbi:cytochrome C [Maribellus sp. CM-23]|uniref:cytochrome c3 family protein n=1 Tax=Maribellus sp. CM-23 TaxID=2781026 RepID=UPI001F197A83|nr:cytochrome c3 family protein [Maribellus sp. CM-23]MCE4563222.1 cytochrome C [Maribellus sp. CM-23]